MKVLITGAAGFIGKRLVEQLIGQNVSVRSFVRDEADVRALQNYDCELAHGDTVSDPASLVRAVQGVDVVYHLAASTHAVRSKDLLSLNVTGLTNVMKACARQSSPPTLVFVSSLAAVGPNRGEQPLRENVSRMPVSDYGRSKAACEETAMQWARRLPITIVRPSIVLGPGDRQGFAMFRSIERTGCHFVPGFRERMFSVIHVDDLVQCLIAAANNGQRISGDSISHGVYFAASEQPYSYAKLGQMIGDALNRKSTRIVRIPKALMWLLSATNEIRGRVSGRAQFLNLDKFREAFAGSWHCSNKKICDELGVQFPCSIQQRLEQTARWYREHGWLPRVNSNSSQTPAATVREHWHGDCNSNL